MRKFTRGKIASFVDRYATSEVVLDIGSGGVDHGASFPNLVTFDIDPKRNPQIVGDIHDMKFESASFSTILCSEVLEHLKDPRRAISEMQRVLKSGGLLILTTRFVYPVHDAPADFFRYTPYGLRELFKDWEIIEMQMESDAFSTIAVLLQRIIFQANLRGGKLTKLIFNILAHVFNHLDWLVVDRYGDIKRSSTVPVLMSSGVYIVCRKRPQTPAA